MFYSNNVQETRQVFYTSWQKYRQKQTLLPLEQQIVNVILDHPEYHQLLERPTPYLDQAYFPEAGQTNPFLHLGLHLAVRDQIATNRPLGITQASHDLLQKHQNPLTVEHILLEALAECLWQAQRNQCPPDEQQYLAVIKKLIMS